MYIYVYIYIHIYIGDAIYLNISKYILKSSLFPTLLQVQFIFKSDIETKLGISFRMHLIIGTTLIENYFKKREK
jgi:DUF1680 family protein